MNRTISALTKFSTRIALSVLAGVGAVAFFQESGFAQTSQTVDPLQDLRIQENTDPFSNRGDTNSSVLDWIHRGMQGNIRSQEEFGEDQRDSLNDAAAQFRQKQQELLRAQPQVQPTASEQAPASEGQKQ